jgi:hypothetical protein
LVKACFKFSNALVRSDHGALRWLLNFKNPEGQIARWFEILAAYDFEIEHRAGRSHANADAMSHFWDKQELGNWSKLALNFQMPFDIPLSIQKTDFSQLIYVEEKTKAVSE